MSVNSGKVRKLVDRAIALTYDGEKVLGKTPSHWGKCAICYSILYISMATILGAISILFQEIILDDFIPTYGYPDGFLQSPGLAFLPQESTGRSNLIRWVRGDDDDVAIWANILTDYLNAYENVAIEGDNVNTIDCSRGRTDFNPEKVCNFDIQIQLGPCAAVDDYGYDDGTPCIVFKLNKIVDWMPENYAPDEVPEEIKHIWENNTIAFTCEGADAATREHLGDMEYFPGQGFSFDYFPYRNQIGYLAPLVGVQFQNVKTNQILFIECKAWAKNIIHDKSRRLGVITVEFLSD